MPVYLAGKVVPVDLGAMATSVVLYLFLPFALAYAVQKAVIARRGGEYFFGSLKKVTGELKLWALVVVIVAMFASQRALGAADLGRVALIIPIITAFFAMMFLVALVVGRLGRLSYEENATLAFTTTARNSEAVIGVAVSAFPGHPVVYFAIVLGPVVELPMLLLISRLMLDLRSRLWPPQALPTAAQARGTVKV